MGRAAAAGASDAVGEEGGGQEEGVRGEQEVGGGAGGGCWGVTAWIVLQHVTLKQWSFDGASAISAQPLRDDDLEN